MLAIMALVAIGCAEEIDTGKPSVESGDEVQFGLSIGSPNTKTIYGPGSDKAFPIYWVDGDKVKMYSPECLPGRNFAEYEVSVSDLNQNYANSLTKTGAYGVQWTGEEGAPCNFYSIYPSGSYTMKGDIIENLSINYSQDIFLASDGVTLSNMSDCLMHASTTAKVGEVVNLTYRPIATTILLDLKLADNANSTADETLTIQSIKLTAGNDVKIAGTFNANLSNGSFSEWVEGHNSISLQISNSATGGFYQMTEGGNISVPVFLVPVEELDINDWEIEVVTDQATFIKKLARTDEASTALAAGKVHKISLPALSIASGDWNVGDWMTNIPRNVYLSEVSIPGSWNSLNSDCQGNTPTIAAQYDLGARAFHLDCRWSTTQAANWAGVYPQDNLDTGQMYLSVADGNTGRHVRAGTTALSSSYGQIMTQNNTSFTDYLTQITSRVQPNEYMVLLCSFAQNSYDGEKCPKTWYQAISDVCEENDQVYDAKKITPNTLVGDVLGKVIVVVNVPININEDTALPSGKCIFANFPSELSATHFDEDYTDNYDGLWYYSESTKAASNSGITMFNCQSQITSSRQAGINTERGYAPSIEERLNVLTAILDWSKTNYGTENYAHDQWIYLGLGGYQMSSYSSDGSGYDNIAQTYNTWIQGKVDEMGSVPEGQSEVVPYYPVGIVLMNFVTEYPETLKNILLLNNKYRLQYDPSKPSDYVPLTNSVAASYSSGMNDSNVSAFGWD